MGRYWIALFAIVLGISGGVADSADAGVWTDSQAALRVQSTVEVAAMPSTASCPTFYATVEIELIGKKRACIAGGPRSVAIVYENGGYFVAASGSPGGKRSLVDGVCTQGMSCFYSVASDSFIEKQYTGPEIRGLKISRNFSDSLEWHFSTQQLRWNWKYTGPTEKESLKDVEGIGIRPEAIGMSENGKWLAVEMSEKGVALVNLIDGTVRRLQDEGYLYGRGMNPSHEFSIADDGSAVVVAGSNSGFTVIRVTPGCGQPLRQSSMERFSLNVVRCQASSEGIGGALPGVRMYGAPRINQVARQITTVARTQSGSLYLMTLGLGDRPAPTPYIALGESFVSGQGETDDAQYQLGTNEPFEKCHVSKRSYPYLLIPTGKNVACSGAQIPDLIGSSWYKGQGERLREFLREEQFDTAKTEALQQFLPGRIGQLDFVRTYQPEATTVSIGGNDIGLMDKLRSCIGPGTCDWAKPENMGKTAREVQALHPRLVESYAQILAAAHETRLFVVGYPDVVRPDGKCDVLTATLLNADERKYMQKTVDYLNQIVASAAGTAGLQYVNLSSVFGEHGLCGSSPQKAMNGLRFGDDSALLSLLPEMRVIGSESFHPTPFGHQLIVAAIRQQTDTLKKGSCTLQCVSSTITPTPDVGWNVSATTPRSILRSVTNPIRAITDKQLAVTIQGGLFKDDSEVEVKAGQASGKFEVKSNDDSRAIVAVDLTGGYHTVSVQGVDTSGELIELYQVIYVEPEEKGGLYGGSPEDLGALVPVKSVPVDNTPAQTSDIPSTTRTASLYTTPLVEVATRAVATSPDEPVKNPVHRQPSSGNYAVFIGLATAAVGIIGTCLVFARLLRK